MLDELLRQIEYKIQDHGLSSNLYLLKSQQCPRSALKNELEQVVYLAHSMGLLLQPLWVSSHQNSRVD